MTQKRFENQSAIVTGAGEGIGYAIAYQLCAEGASVLLNDIVADRAEAAAKKIQSETGGTCIGVGGDVAQVEVVRGFVTRAIEEFGKLDICVSNAGLTSWGDFFDYTEEDFERVLNVNMRGSFFLTQAAARHFREQGNGGRIILMSSVTAHSAVKYIAAYAMTKAALEMLARTLSLELGPHGITVNSVAPGSTITPRNLNDDPNYEKHWEQVHPLRKAMQPDDIANAVLFLASPAADKITGQTIIVDAGWTTYSPAPDMDFAQDYELDDTLKGRG